MSILLPLLAFAYLGWGLAVMAAAVGFVAKYAIPRAPWFFRYPLLVPCLVTATSCFVIFDMAVIGDEHIMGVDALGWLLANAGSQLVFYWALVGYSVYHYFKNGRPRCPA